MQIKENNIYVLQKVDESAKKDMEIALGVGLSDFNNSTDDKKFYIKDLITLKDDDIRKQLKEIKIEKKVEELEPLEGGSEEFPIRISIFKENYTLKDGSNKNMYSFTLE